MESALLSITITISIVNNKNWRSFSCFFFPSRSFLNYTCNKIKSDITVFMKNKMRSGWLGVKWTQQLQLLIHKVPISGDVNLAFKKKHNKAKWTFMHWNLWKKNKEWLLKKIVYKMKAIWPFVSYILSWNCPTVYCKKLMFIIVWASHENFTHTQHLPKREREKAHGCHYPLTCSSTLITKDRQHRLST